MPAQAVEHHWRLQTLPGCQLAIGAYPLFRYDASGGAAAGVITPVGDALQLHCLPADIHIPPLDARSTRLLGLSLPPGLSVQVITDQLEGQLEPSAGALTLELRARFRFRAGFAGRTLLAPPDLQVHVLLSTDPLQSRRHRRCGSRRDADGLTTLVGVAQVPPCGAGWLDRFLGLPDEALAVLRCRLLVAEAS